MDLSSQPYLSTSQHIAVHLYIYFHTMIYTSLLDINITQNCGRLMLSLSHRANMPEGKCAKCVHIRYIDEI